MTTQRTMTRWAGLLAISAMVFAACSSSGGGAASAGASAAAGAWTPPADLLTAAKAEGTLSTIALPHSWCNYGEALSSFASATGLTLNELLPDGGSGDEIAAQAVANELLELFGKLACDGRRDGEILILFLTQPAKIIPDLDSYSLLLRSVRTTAVVHRSGKKHDRALGHFGSHSFFEGRRAIIFPFMAARDDARRQAYQRGVPGLGRGSQGHAGSRHGPPPRRISDDVRWVLGLPGSPQTNG